MGKSKKQEKREEKVQEQKKMQAVVQQHGYSSTGGKVIPGMATAEQIAAAQRIPGMAAQGVNVPRAVPPPASEAAKEEPKGDSTSVNIKVPEERVGVVIGPKGKNIKLIQEKTGVTRIDTTGMEFTISGPAKAVAEAEMAIKDLISKGYTHLAYDDFQEDFVMVLDKKLPDIIGKKGAIIIKLKEALGVEVTIPKVVAPGKKCKVTIAGATDAVKKGKEVIESICQYQHHEVTHPGEIPEEMDIPPECYAWIIGSKGSELRHIQNNYRVKVSIPRESHGSVLVVGAKEDVPRAVTYIWKICEGGKEKGDRTSVAADDGYGDEGPEEDWMKQYMYKRH